MSITKQAKLGLGMLAAVVLMAAVSGVILALREDEPTSTPLTASPVAAIVFDSPTQAWISSSGTQALYADGGAWMVGTYGYEGQTDVVPAQGVEGEVVPPVVIDGTEFGLVDDVQISDQHDGTWLVAIDDAVTSVVQPAGWDGSEPTAMVSPEGTVVIVAALGDDGTAIVEGDATCTLEGQWLPVAVEAQRILLTVADPAGLDHSVSAVNRCA